MRDSVASNFVALNAPLEGVLRFMYTDDEPPTAANPSGLVTTAMGYMMPTPESATELEWVNPDGSAASAQAVMAAWQAVHGGPRDSSVNAGTLTTIRLTDAGVQDATAKRIAQDEPLLREGFPAYDSWPADAQMAVLSMAWAMGPAFWRDFPAFTAAVNASPPRFGEAARYDATRYPNGKGLGDFRGTGVEKRKEDDDALWTNAQAVLDRGLDPDVLYWPNDARLVAQGSITSPLFMVTMFLLALAFGAAWEALKGR